MIELKSIEEEEEDCRARFRRIGVGSWVMFCHHGILVEQLRESPKNRIRYILHEKPKGERALRLHLFRPIPTDVADDYDAKRKPLDDDLIARFAPGAPWDGRTIFCEHTP